MKPATLSPLARFPRALFAPALFALAAPLAAKPLVVAHLAPHRESSPELGQAEARCRPNEPGPALLVEILGLRDRKGLVKAEVYPATEADFLADDNVLLNAGKVFRRAEQDLADSGPVVLCLRVPAPGPYAVAVLHDRDGNHKFGWWGDGVGFPGYQRLGMHKPKVARAIVVAGPGLTRVPVTMMYRHGLGVATLRAAEQD